MPGMAFLVCLWILSCLIPGRFPCCRCIKAGKWQTAGKADAWKLLTEGHRVFDGLRIFPNGDAATLGPLRKLLPYAGELSDSMHRLSMRQL